MIPKGLVENLEWRKRLKDEAEADPAAAAGLLTLCRKSPILFVNLFVDTLRFSDFTKDGEKVPTNFRRRPMITWPCQDRELLSMDARFNEGRHGRGVKSREMGWTWLLIAYHLWHFTLFEDRQILWGSRKEELLYKIGDQDAIFTKFEFALSRMPAFLLPEKCRITERLIINPATGGKISGEATNPHFGHGGRNDLVCIDEASRIDILEDIEAGVRDNCTSLMLISTPRPGSYFGTLRTSPAYEQCRLGWYEHPEKGLGRRDLNDDEFEVYVTSPWDQKQRPPNRTAASYASQVAMNEGRSGDMVFSHETLRKARGDCVEADHVGGLVFANAWGGGNASPTSEPEELAEADDRLSRRQTHLVRWEEDSRKIPMDQWQVWLPLSRDERLHTIRPPQDRMYTLFLDPGDGRRSANSVICVMDAETGEQVAEWCSSRYGARDAARILVAAALWFGGCRYPLIGWESNGPMGGAVSDIVGKRLRYPNCYCDRVGGRAGPDKRTERLGWMSTGHKKPVLIDNFADAVSSGACRVRSLRLVEEAATFVVMEDGKVSQSQYADLTTGAREAHGDRVIAGAGCWMLVKESPKTVRKARIMDEGPMDPVLSFGGRLVAQRREEAKAKLPRWRRIG